MGFAEHFGQYLMFEDMNKSIMYKDFCNLFKNSCFYFALVELLNSKLLQEELVISNKNLLFLFFYSSWKYHDLYKFIRIIVREFVLLSKDKNLVLNQKLLRNFRHE